jgi:hypothetical protein
MNIDPVTSTRLSNQGRVASTDEALGKAQAPTLPLVEIEKGDCPERRALVSAALVAAQGELEAAHFDSSNPYFKSKYASLGAVIEVSRPVLAKHGLAIQQTPKTIRDGFIGVQTTIIHSSGQTLDGGWIELPLGDEKGTSLAQKAGGLISYIKRYAWSSVLGIYADEDNDGNEPQKPPQKPPQTRQNTPPSDSKPSGVSEPPPKSPDVAKTRLRALNLLKACPGQDNRGMVDRYFRAKGWIGMEQGPEDWPETHIPMSKEALSALQLDIQAFVERELAEEDELKGLNL